MPAVLSVSSGTTYTDVSDEAQDAQTQISITEQSSTESILFMAGNLAGTAYLIFPSKNSGTYFLMVGSMPMPSGVCGGSCQKSWAQ